MVQTFRSKKKAKSDDAGKSPPDTEIEGEGAQLGISKKKKGKKGKLSKEEKAAVEEFLSFRKSNFRLFRSIISLYAIINVFVKLIEKRYVKKWICNYVFADIMILYHL